MNSNLKYINLDFSSQSDAEICSYCETLKGSNEEWIRKVAEFTTQWLNSNDSIVAHSSGTTGKAKLFTIPKNKIKNSALLTAQTFAIKEGTKALLCLSTDFIAGKMMIARSAVNRWNLFITEPLSNPLKNIDVDLDFAAFVPNQVFEILSSSEKSKFNRIKKVIIGGGEINESLHSLLKEVKTEVFQTFGMTETVSHIAVKQIWPHHQQYYKALEGIHFGVNDNNCLIIFAPSLDANAIYTNDCVTLIDKFSFEWRGRFDNIINSGGVKINPESIEQKIKKHIASDFIVSSIPDDKLINKLILIVEGEEEISLEKVNQELHKFEQIKEIVHVDKLERTSSNKIKRKH
ncbi:MAG: AMP-binding protein [Flavobacteriales bacterium]